MNEHPKKLRMLIIGEELAYHKIYTTMQSIHVRITHKWNKMFGNIVYVDVDLK